MATGHEKPEDDTASQGEAEMPARHYDHVMALAFSVETREQDGEDITPDIARAAIERRMADLDSAGTLEWKEALLPPFDTTALSDRAPHWTVEQCEAAAHYRQVVSALPRLRVGSVHAPYEAARAKVVEQAHATAQRFADENPDFDGPLWLEIAGIASIEPLSDEQGGCDEQQ